MNAQTFKRWLLPIIVTLALPAASRALIWATIPLPSNPSVFMGSNVNSTSQADPVRCANAFALPTGQTLRYIKVWGWSSTAVPLFRVSVAWRGFNPLILHYDALVAPIAITTHPQNSQLRQYTLAVGPVNMYADTWMVIVARDTRYGTPWFWAQGPNPTGDIGRFQIGGGSWNSTTSFVMDLSDAYF